MRERRRGADLERALLDAAWQELAEKGYSGLTMEGVADRAGTSRPVIARRWDGKASLAIAAIRHQVAKHPLDVPDLGDFRAELLTYLDRASARAEGTAAALTLFASAFHSENSTNPGSLRRTLLQGEVKVFPVILNRAVERGEADPEKLVPPVATLLQDLFRHYIAMNFVAPPEELRQAWVDRVFLPLVKAN